MNTDVNKFLSKEQLIKALELVPDNSALITNSIGNLAVFDSLDLSKYIGYVDFLHGKFYPAQPGEQLLVKCFARHIED